jgi:hypothetical protein
MLRGSQDFNVADPQRFNGNAHLGRSQSKLLINAI